MQNARMTITTKATGNYSYYSDLMVGKNYILIGDAFAFIDPIFSSGVHLALTSATHAIGVIEATLNGVPKLPSIQREYERKSKHGFKTLSWFIYRINQPAMRNLFMAPRRKLCGIEEAVLSMLAGDLYRKSTIDFQILLFKILYYISFCVQWKQNWSAYKSRKPKVPDSFSLSMSLLGFNLRFW
jgi:flavin-dependent dehydrogenase